MEKRKPGAGILKSTTNHVIGGLLISQRQIKQLLASSETTENGPSLQVKLCWKSIRCCGTLLLSLLLFYFAESDGNSPLYFPLDSKLYILLLLISRIGNSSFPQSYSFLVYSYIHYYKATCNVMMSLAYFCRLFLI